MTDNNALHVPFVCHLDKRGRYIICLDPKAFGSQVFSKAAVLL